MSRRPLRVVAPHATATGSTAVLLDLLALAAPELPVPLEVVVQAGGPRLAELQALGPPPLDGTPPAAVLVNTCIAADHLVDLPADVPSIVYVHEVGQVIASLPERAAQGLRLADEVLCVSEDARADLIEAGIAAERITLLPPLVVPAAVAPAGAAAAVRASLGLSPEDRLFLGCGEASERKGADLFIQVGIVAAEDPRVQLVWLGRRLRSISRLLDHDTEVAGIEGRLRWVDAVDDPAAHLAAADLLVMTSRSDPQPLVPLEAAQQGTPTVGFAVGGVRELGAAGAALTVPYPDVYALARAAGSVLDDPGLGASLVRQAIGRRDARQSAARVLPVFLAVVERAIASRAPGTP